MPAVDHIANNNHAPHPHEQADSGLRGLLKSAIRRALRPAVWDLQQEVTRLEGSVAELRQAVQLAAIRTGGAVWRGGFDGAAFGPDGNLDQVATAKYRDELSYWIAAIGGRDPGLGDRFIVTFHTWQRTRLNELADRLKLNRGSAMDDWCRLQDVVEIGGGPIPCCGFRSFRTALAVDPLADGYVTAGLAQRTAGVTHIAACGEAIPLTSASADLVISENCLDHTDDPSRVIAEIHRILKPGGLLWLLVDLMDYTDHMHPSPMSESRLDNLVLPRGFTYEYKDSWEGASHPMAKKQLRALLRR